MTCLAIPQDTVHLPRLTARGFVNLLQRVQELGGHLIGTVVVLGGDSAEAMTRLGGKHHKQWREERGITKTKDYQYRLIHARWAVWVVGADDPETYRVVTVNVEAATSAGHVQETVDVKIPVEWVDASIKGILREIKSGDPEKLKAPRPDTVKPDRSVEWLGVEGQNVPCRLDAANLRDVIAQEPGLARPVAGRLEELLGVVQFQDQGEAAAAHYHGCRLCDVLDRLGRSGHIDEAEAVMRMVEDTFSDLRLHWEGEQTESLDDDVSALTDDDGGEVLGPHLVESTPGFDDGDPQGEAYWACQEALADAYRTTDADILAFAAGMDIPRSASEIADAMTGSGKAATETKVRLALRHAHWPKWRDGLWLPGWWPEGPNQIEQPDDAPAAFDEDDAYARVEEIRGEAYVRRVKNAVTSGRNKRGRVIGYSTPEYVRSIRQDEPERSPVNDPDSDGLVETAVGTTDTATPGDVVGASPSAESVAWVVEHHPDEIEEP